MQLSLLSLCDRISRGVLDKISKYGEKKKIHEDGETRKDGRTALLILVGFLSLQSRNEVSLFLNSLPIYYLIPILRCYNFALYNLNHSKG